MKAATAHAPFIWRGYRLDLLAERAIWDPQQRSLLVADLHLGKAEIFQAHGVPLPSDGDATCLDVLLELAHRLRPAQVMVLGDLIHGRIGLTVDLRQKLMALPELLGCPLRLIDGNHERGSWLQDLRREPACAIGPLWLSHGPDPQPELLNLCGHLHPVAVVGKGRDRLRLPCFHYQRGVASPPGGHGQRPSDGAGPGGAGQGVRRGDRLVLPAFGPLTGGHPCSDADGLWLIAEGTVVPWVIPGLESQPLRPVAAP